MPTILATTPFAIVVLPFDVFGSLRTVTVVSMGESPRWDVYPATLVEVVSPVRVSAMMKSFLNNSVI